MPQWNLMLLNTTLNRLAELFECTTHSGTRGGPSREEALDRLLEAIGMSMGENEATKRHQVMV
jgi:hypothetical protein